ncbi:MAG: YraN family protein [Candidatus Paceibacterota bacterium]
MKNFGSKDQKGLKGENVAVSHLLKLGFEISERNFWAAGREIDIIAFKDGVLHFVEVKSSFGSISADSEFLLREKVNKKKMDGINRAVRFYLERKGMEDTYWVVDLISVFFSREGDLLKVSMEENIVL